MDRNAFLSALGYLPSNDGVNYYDTRNLTNDSNYQMVDPSTVDQKWNAYQAANAATDPQGRPIWGSNGAPLMYQDPNIGAINYDDPYFQLPITVGGQQRYQIGMTPADFLARNKDAPSAGKYTADTIGGGYDPTYGYYADPGIVGELNKERGDIWTQKGNQGFWNGMGPWALALALGSAVAGPELAAGAAAEGGAGAAGSTLPASYWSMLAGEVPSGGMSIAPAAGEFGAGTVGGTAGVGTAGGSLFGSIGGAPAAFGAPGFGAAAGDAAAAAGLLGAGGAAASGGGNLLGSIANWLTPGTGVSGLQSLGLLSSGISGIANAFASKSAANTAADASNRATDAQLGIFNTINQQQLPYRLAGYSSLGSILGGQGLGPASGGVSSGQFTHQFDANDLKTNLAPNYQFQLDQGLGAVTNQMNRSGGLVSGNTLKGINDYAQNYAGNAYQNAFNNYNANQTNIFNRLSTIAGLGQTANQSTGQAGASISPGVANTIVGSGQAQAAGTIGAANAFTGAANNAMGWYALPSLLNLNNGSANA